MSSVLRKILTSVFLSAAILSIASLDSVLHEGSREKEFARERMKQAKDTLRQRLETAQSKPALGKAPQSRGLENMLRDSLSSDEFGEQLPFANLSTLDPLAKVLSRGVVHYERTVFRSPDYQGESGYDLVQYEIEHRDGQRSTLLAYLDRPALTFSRSVGAPDSRIPVVMVLQAQGQTSAYSLYRSGNLIEQSEVSYADVSSLVADRISLSIPFLSVSR